MTRREAGSVESEPEQADVEPEALADPGTAAAELADAIDADPKLAKSWATGAKLTKGRDSSASALEFSLVSHLAWHGHDDALIELAVRHYPHGQVGGGKLNDHNAERRIERLLQEAAKVRERLQDRSWIQDLICGDKGPKAIEANVEIALRADPAFVGKIRFNEFALNVECSAMPWSRARDGAPGPTSTTSASALVPAPGRAREGRHLRQGGAGRRRREPLPPRPRLPRQRREVGRENGSTVGSRPTSA